MKINRRTVLSTAAVLGVAALIAGGTIAYFTDTEKTDNNFTVGKIDVTLYESQLHRVNSNVASTYHDTEGTTSPVSTNNFHMCANGNVYCTPNIAVGTDLSDVSAWKNGHIVRQNVAGLNGSSQVGVFSDSQIKGDAVKIEDNQEVGGTTAVDATATNPGNYADYRADEYVNITPGKSLRKFVYVENTESSDAYVRITVKVPSEVANLVTAHAPSAPFKTFTGNPGLNINNMALTTTYWNALGKDGSTVSYSGTGASANVDYDAGGDYNGYIDEDGSRVYRFLLTDALKSGEMTYWSPINTVYINSDATSAQLANITDFNVTVEADAIQSDGFASAAAAFDAFDNQQ